MKLKVGYKFLDNGIFVSGDKKSILEITKITGHKNNLIEFNNSGCLKKNEVENYILVGMMVKINEPQREYFQSHKAIRQTIKDKFWNDLAQDIPNYSYKQLESLFCYFRGYSNGLLSSGVLSIDEHIEITARLDQRIIWEKHERFIKGLSK